MLGRLSPAPRLGLLRVHGADPEAWMRRHGVEPFDHPCGDCGRTFVANIPFAWGTMRGLIADPCPCGNTDTPLVVAFASMMASDGDL